MNWPGMSPATTGVETEEEQTTESDGDQVTPDQKEEEEPHRDWADEEPEREVERCEPLLMLATPPCTPGWESPPDPSSPLEQALEAHVGEEDLENL